MIDTTDMWNCIKWLLYIVLMAALGFGIFLGIILNFSSSKTNTNPTSSEVVGKLEDGSSKHSIPKNTEIVAACTDNCGVFAYIVKDAKGNHYYVGLLSREVRKIEEVNVINLEKVLCEPNRQEFKYKVKEL